MTTSRVSAAHDPLAEGEDDTTTAESRPPAAARHDDEPSERTLRPLMPPGSLAPATKLSPSEAGISVPSSVEIRTLEDEDREDETETEVRTTPGIPLSQVPPTLRPMSSAAATAPRPAAGVPPPSEAARSTMPDLDPPRLFEDSEDGATTQAQRIIASIEDEANATTQDGPRSASTYEEDSVTTRAPPVTTAQIEAVVANADTKRRSDPETVEGPTKRIPKRPPAAGKPPPSSPESPADGETESITTQAPAPLTNMLRVIAADDDAYPDTDEEEPENNTAVMPNAPLKRLSDDVLALTPKALPALRPTRPVVPLPNAGPMTGAALRAPQLAPGSESGLRSTRPSSGVALAAHDPRAFAATEAFQATPSVGHLLTPPPGSLATLPPVIALAGGPPSMQPIAQDVPPPKGPRYGLLVGVVALVSLAVPASLYVGLQGRDDGAPSSATPAAAESELESHDGTPRGKLDKKAIALAAAASANAAASASAVASASASAHGGRPPPTLQGGRRH